ncbi:helix-turn-helix domain-containing protein [Pendulispora rubella]|uniref:methyltransferase family protein n=1 Tax=Pendulispora rubella TaxID=2741070 RepID=UPI00374E1269
MSSAIKSSPSPRQLDTLLGARGPQALYAATKFGFADLLASGPKTLIELSQLTNVPAPSVLRLLRTLASVGIFIELDDGRFANTRLSHFLRAESSNSMNERPLTSKKYSSTSK